jgi:RecB family endonuclease NucS
LLKGDGSILVHSDSGSYKPLNWMNPPCSITTIEVTDAARELGVVEAWQVEQGKTGDKLLISIHHIFSDVNHDLGEEPGLVKDGVEANLQELLAEQVSRVHPEAVLVRREYFTAIGPVDILLSVPGQGHIAVELKRRGEIDGVEQLTRYLDLLNRDPLLAPVRGVFAAQEIKPQARTLAEDRGIECLVLDYDDLKGSSPEGNTLF